MLQKHQRVARMHDVFGTAGRLHIDQSIDRSIGPFVLESFSQ
jgi:hypothetical protein